MKAPLKIEIDPGSHIREAALNAVAKAKELNRVIEFEFNEIPVVVAPGDDPEGIVQRFSAECQRRSDEYYASPAGIEDKKRQEEYQSKADASAAEGIKPFSILEGKEADWKTCVEKNSDSYGAGTVRYAARWAHLMEKRMESGQRIADMANKCSSEADTEGITGFMYGCAVNMLAHIWKHGEALRLWHNKTTQLGTEGDKANETGGVLNPALLNIG